MAGLCNASVTFKNPPRYAGSRDPSRPHTSTSRRKIREHLGRSYSVSGYKGGTPNRPQRSRIRKECTGTLLNVLSKEQRLGWVERKGVSVCVCVGSLRALCPLWHCNLAQPDIPHRSRNRKSSLLRRSDAEARSFVVLSIKYSTQCVRTRRGELFSATNEEYQHGLFLPFCTLWTQLTSESYISAGSTTKKWRNTYKMSIICQSENLSFAFARSARPDCEMDCSHGARCEWGVPVCMCWTKRLACTRQPVACVALCNCLIPIIKISCI